MGNLPPTLDEIKRQNKCLKQCADEFLASDTVWRQLYDDKLIDLARARAEMNKDIKMHSRCCDECVPTIRRLSDEQKRSSEHAEAAGLGIGVPGLALGTGLAVLLDEPPVAVVYVVVAGSAVAIGIAIGLEILDLDPIDPNFSIPPVPSIPRLPVIRPVPNTGLTSSVAQAANAWLTNQAKTLGLLNALRTALDRGDGAADAGDASSERKQLKAARRFAKRLADLLRDAAPLRLALASKWTAPDLDIAISGPDASRVRDDIIINGFPSPIVDALTKAGFDQNDQDAMLRKIVIDRANRPSFHSIRFRKLLVDQKLQAAEAGLITSLEQFARSA